MNFFQVEEFDDNRLYLIHVLCEQVLCAVENGDTLSVLNDVAENHVCPA
jgi:hypothetical protein